MTGPGVRTAAEILAGTSRETDRRPGRQWLPQQHGTVAGFSQHRRRDEPACKPCADAEAARKADNGARARAWRAATRRLVEAHRSEFARFYNEEKTARGV